MRVLIACEESGKVRDAFSKLGHYALSCDIKPTRSPGNHYQGNVLDIIDDGWDLMIAHPPCTRLTNAGVRWLTNAPPKGKTAEQMWKEFDEAAEFYCLLRDTNIPKKAIENPVMHCYAIDRIGNPVRQVVQPWWFGEKAFKATGFELYGLPNLIPTNKLVPPEKGTEEHKKWSFIHRMAPGKLRAQNRSETFQGIADAMADQWGKL